MTIKTKDFVVGLGTITVFAWLLSRKTSSATTAPLSPVAPRGEHWTNKLQARERCVVNGTPCEDHFDQQAYSVKVAEMGKSLANTPCPPGYERCDAVLKQNVPSPYGNRNAFFLACSKQITKAEYDESTLTGLPDPPDMKYHHSVIRPAYVPLPTDAAFLRGELVLPPLAARDWIIDVHSAGQNELFPECPMPHQIQSIVDSTLDRWGKRGGR